MGYPIVLPLPFTFPKVHYLGGSLRDFELVYRNCSEIDVCICSIWQGSAACKILLQGVGVICPAGNHHFENFLTPKVRRIGSNVRIWDPKN
jgi:hypothetical protein